MKRKHKHLRRLGRVLIVLVLLIAAVAVYQIIALRPFWKTSEKAFPHPALEESRFDEQGIAYDAGSGYFLFGGYMRDKSADRVYLIDPGTGDILRYVQLLNADGTPFTGHMGGIAVYRDYVYAAGSSDCCLYVYDRREILEAKEGESVRSIGVFPTALSDTDGVKVSFVTVGDGKLFVGEFHLPLLPPYRLRANHRITANGETTSALMAAFELDENSPFGLKEKPVAAYCLPDMVQGVSVTDGKITLSRSFGFVLSDIRLCETAEAGEFRLMDATVPLYTLKKTKSLKAPPMAEEIETVDGKLYMATELQNFLIKSIGNLWNGRWVYTVPAGL